MMIFKNILIVAAASFLLFTTEAFASAGNIIYAYGDNYALNNAGKKRKLTKGAEVFAGDKLVTGTKGRMHLRFSDGGMVSVYPRSEYKIDEYEFDEADTKKQKGFFSLLKGGARQITGLLGKQKRDNFRFRTTVATIGIRGTGFFVQLCNADCNDPEGKLLPDGMYVKNDTGIISMSNEAGSIELAQGQSAHAASNNDAPQQINEPIAPYNLANDDIEKFDFDIGDAVETDITLVSILSDGPVEPPPPTVLTLTRLESSFIKSGTTETDKFTADVEVAGHTISHNSNSITAYNGVDSSLGLPTAFDSTGATLQESGADQAFGVIWSRWSGNFGLTQGGSPVTPVDNNIHLIGSESLTALMPTIGTLSYQSIDGTFPTFVGPSFTGVGTQSIAFDINYASGSITNFSLVATFGAETITATLSNTSEFITGNSSSVPLTASCPVLCNFTGGQILSGAFTINLVGANAEAAYGIYGLSNGFDAAVTGSYLATGN